MNRNSSFFGAVVLCAALAATAVAAQDGSAQYATDTGNLTVTYGQPGAPDYGPRPDFGTLDADSSGGVDMSEARAYRLLDVDFDHADGNRDHRISAREYARWPQNR